MARRETTYAGRCHCGAIGYRYTVATPPAHWAIRACQCRFCRSHDALSTSDPTGTIAFEASSPDQLQRYRFGLNTADFLLCRRCGVYIGASIDTPKGRFGIINTRALVDPQPSMSKSDPISYDDEDTDGRVSRREERWSPVTVIPE
ncbi:MAG: hypothetical protein QNJ11_02195 [Woeseiaceae bacterium]|nr:hypothetical protein [Woeseiaceae bacterium]